MTLAVALLEDLRSDDPQVRRYLKRISRLTARLGRLEDAEVRRALSLLADARRRILDDLAALPLDRRDALQAVALDNLRLMIEREARRFADDYGVSLRGALGRAWGMGGDFAPDTLSTMGIDLVLRPELSRAQLELAQGYVADLIRRVGDDFRDRVSSRLRLGVLGGESVASLQRKIADDLRTQPSRTVPKLGPIASQSERIVRTELGRIWAIANDQRHQEIAEQVPEVRKVWLATRDGRTRPDHAAAGRKYAPGGTPGPITVSEDYRVGGERAKYPRDPRLSAGQAVNCRCVSVLYNPEWERMKRQAAR